MLHPTPTGSQRRGQEALSASSRRPPLGGDGLYLRPAERTSVRRPTAIQSLNCDRASSRIKATALAADIPRGFAACYHTRGFRRGAWRASRRVIRRYRSPMAPQERDAAGFPGNLTVSPCFFTKSKTRARTFIRWRIPPALSTTNADGSISLSPLYPSPKSDLHVSTSTSLHQSFLWLRPAQA